MSERTFQNRVVRYAEQHEWLAYHAPDNVARQRVTPGFPDLVLIRPPRVVFAELKDDDGRVSAAQRMWARLLLDCPGVEYYLWYAHDWESAKLVLE